MNPDQLNGKRSRFEGKVNQPYGKKFTEDDLPPTKGNRSKLVGKARERFGDKKDEDMKWSGPRQQRSQPEASTEKTRRGESHQEDMDCGVI